MGQAFGCQNQPKNQEFLGVLCLKWTSGLGAASSENFGALAAFAELCGKGESTKISAHFGAPKPWAREAKSDQKPSQANLESKVPNPKP